MPRREEAPAATIVPKRDDSHKMKVVEWHGTKDIQVKEVGKPLVTDPEDVVLKVTSTCICGSDLHFYTGAMPGLKSGDIVGHEFMGIVEDVGPQVQSVKRGDRVAVAFDIACGRCFSCHHEAFSGCDNTNPSKEQALMYGHTSAGMFGYSHLTGGWPGGQAEYARVPFANTMCLKIPDSVPDDKAVLLTDILPTAWHANELAQTGKGDNVAIWGSGPVGLLAAHCAQARGAARVVLIDGEQDRLDFATKHLPGVETINFQKQKTTDALKEKFEHGPDCAIEAVGFHYTKSWLHWFEMALKLETDPSEILNELITSVRKGGRIGVVGVYAGFSNHFNIGAFMEKGLSMAAGQTPVQKYWKHLLQLIQEGKLDPSFVVTHHLPLEQAPYGYKIFNDKAEGCFKVVLKPGMPATASAEQ